MEPNSEESTSEMSAGSVDTPLLKSKLGKPVKILFIFLYFIFFATPAVFLSVMAGPIGIIFSLILFIVIPIQIINKTYSGKSKTPEKKKTKTSLVLNFLGIIFFFTWFLWFVSPFFRND